MFGLGKGRDKKKQADKPAATSQQPVTRPTKAPLEKTAQQGSRPVSVAQNKPAIAVRSNMREPSEQELQALIDFTGKIVTAENGNIPLTPQQRNVMLAFDNGTVLISKSAKNSALVSSVRVILRQHKYVATQVYFVDLETIRVIYEKGLRRSGDKTSGADMQRMQQAVIDLIRTAAQLKCSDIHITIDRYEAHIRVRSDGVMMPLRDLPSATAADLLQAAFYMADASDAQYKMMDYQGARISSAANYTLPEGVQAVRLQYTPLPDNGRLMVARLLYQQKIMGHQDVDNLGYAQSHIKHLRHMRNKPHGMVIISGPTGSGKSTTLQTALQATAREKNYEVNIITVEDPPEYHIKGASQIPVVNVKTEDERHEAFRAAIAASLRLDPDIIMIGEIRDSASASLAFQAAMTGHQVWASLHANDALSILDRLRDNKVETYKLSDPALVIGLIGQRLVRRLCDDCKLTFDEAIEKGLLSDSIIESVRTRLEGFDEGVCVANPGGCESCNHRGNKGRTVAAETLLPDREFMEFVAQDKKHLAFEHWMNELDGITMLEHALWKVASGLVDPREVGPKVSPIDEASNERMQKVIAAEPLEIVAPANRGMLTKSTPAEGEED